MGEELKLREQRLDICVEDFREKTVYGSSTLVIEVGSSVSAAIASALATSEGDEGARDLTQKDALSSPPVVLPLQVPAACVVKRVWVDEQETEFSLPSEETSNGRSSLSLLGDDQGGIHFDLLSLRLRTAREAARRDGERQMLVQLPEKTVDKFQARVRQRLRVSIDFKLVNPSFRTSSLYFADHWLSPPQGPHRLYRLLLSSHSASSLPWFPTLPVSAYASPWSPPSPDSQKSRSLNKSKEAPSACARCRWVLSVDVPEGNVAVGPGLLVRRARVCRQRRFGAADDEDETKTAVEKGADLLGEVAGRDGAAAEANDREQ
ncbi:bromodomain protein, partial [Toxoplasma gondii RUB]